MQPVASIWLWYYSTRKNILKIALMSLIHYCFSSKLLWFVEFVVLLVQRIFTSCNFRNCRCSSQRWHAPFLSVLHRRLHAAFPGAEARPEGSLEFDSRNSRTGLWLDSSPSQRLPSQFWAQTNKGYARPINHWKIYGPGS